MMRCISVIWIRYFRTDGREKTISTEGENYYGPGVGDMKNGDLAMFHIAANLPETEKKCLNIAMVYNPDEEIGSTHQKRDHGSNRIVKVITFLSVMESAGKMETRHCFREKGSLTYDIEFSHQAAQMRALRSLKQKMRLRFLRWDITL